jgi:protein arginine N-methyltransferase 1
LPNPAAMLEESHTEAKGKPMIQFLKSILRYVYRWVKSHPYLSSIYFDIMNLESFSKLRVHEIMLADKVRMDAYHKAIQKYVKKGDVVIDLGSGSGILSFFASLQGPQKVYAIEHSNTMIKTAEATAKHNGITNITFVNVNSKNFRTTERADVLLQEQIGGFLFDENMVANIVDLRNKALKPSGIILPSKFELFIEPVQMVNEKHIPFIWEQNLHNISFECLENLKEEANGHYGYLFIEPNAIDCFLCEPQRVLYVDLQTVKTEDVPSTIHYVRRIERDGRVDGFCLYFNVVFDEEIKFSTSPQAPKTHFGPILLREQSRDFKRGEWIEFNMKVDDLKEKSTYQWSCKKLIYDELRERAETSLLAELKPALKDQTA